MEQTGDRSRLIRVQVKDGDGSVRRSTLRLAVSDVSTDARLRITLTNDVVEDSEITYFSSCLTADDYRKFREEQGLLVEMSGFAGMIDRMVDMAEADETGARFFTSLEVGVTSGANLSFVEINAFKRLVHLKLKMSCGSDAQIRNHLAGQLRELRDRLAQLSKQNDRSNAELSDRKADVDSLHQQLEALRMSVNEKEASLSSALNREVSAEKERSAAEINSARAAFTTERKRLLDENSTALRRLQNQVASLEYENKDLMERRHRNEASLLGMSEEVKRLTAEIEKLNRDIESRRAENDRAGEGAKQLDQTVQRLQAQVSHLEQENVRLSSQLSLKTELLKTTSEDKIKTEQALADKSQLVTKREAAVKAVSQELVKANEAMKKLQTEARRQAEKVKLSSKILSEQEKLIAKKEAEVEDTRTQLRDASEANREWLTSKDIMKRDIEAKDAEIEQLRKSAKTSETVIQWLNKQLTAAKVRDPGLKIGPPPSSLLIPAGGGGVNTLTSQSAVVPGILATPTGGAASNNRQGKNLVASTPIPMSATALPKGAAAGNAGGDHSDEENHSANPVLDPKYLLPAKAGNNATTTNTAKKGLTKKTTKSSFSPKQTTLANKYQSKHPGQKSTLAESVYFS